MNDKKQDALDRLAAIEIELKSEKLKAIIEALSDDDDEAAPDPRLAWIGKWGFYGDNGPECPDNGFPRRLAGIDPGHKCGDFRLNNDVHWRYFRPATPEELGTGVEATK